MPALIDHIAKALAQLLDEQEYASNENLQFPQLTREESAEILEQLCIEAGLSDFEYPAQTCEVLQLAKNLEYKVSDHTPSYYVNQGLLGGLESLPRYGFQWQPENIVQLLMAAEYRKAWQPKSSRHDYKKSPWCLSRERSDSARNRREFEALKQRPISELLQTLTETPKLESRLVIHEAVTSKLESLGVDLGIFV